MKTVKDMLQLLGFSENEARVYSALNDLGEARVKKVVHVTQLKKPTCYAVLARLEKKGHVKKYEREGESWFKIISLDSLIQKTQTDLSLKMQHIEDLKKLHEAKKGGPKIRVFQGVEGVRCIYEDMISGNHDEIYYIGSAQNIESSLGSEYLRDRVSRRIQKGVKAIALRMESEELSDNIYNHGEKNCRELYFLPPSMTVNDNIITYANKVALVSVKEDGFGFIIESENLAETIKSMMVGLISISKEAPIS